MRFPRPIPPRTKYGGGVRGRGTVEQWRGGGSSARGPVAGGRAEFQEWNGKSFAPEGAIGAGGAPARLGRPQLALPPLKYWLAEPAAGRAGSRQLSRQSTRLCVGAAPPSHSRIGARRVCAREHAAFAHWSPRSPAGGAGPRRRSPARCIRLSHRCPGSSRVKPGSSCGQVCVQARAQRRGSRVLRRRATASEGRLARARRAEAAAEATTAAGRGVWALLADLTEAGLPERGG